jgi:hypothetical protein
MSSYSINLYSLSDATTNISNILTAQTNGAQWDDNQWSRPTLTVNTGATATHVTVNDTDSGSAADTLDDDSTNQVLTAPLTIGTTTYAAGTELQNEYEVRLVDADTGTFYTVVAISVREYTGWGNYTDNIIGFTFEGDVPDEGVTLSYPGSYNRWGRWVPDYNNNYDADYQSMVPCFTKGTLIDTAQGQRAVETLKVGDLVVTADHGVAPVRWIGSRRLQADLLNTAPQMLPIRITKGALGPDMPAQDLLVSPQHRILVRSRIAERMAGEHEVLVAAKHLLSLPGVEIDPNVTEVTYLHLVFDQHEIIFAQGAATESLYTGEQALKAISSEARQEILTLFPSLLTDPEAPQPARPLFAGKLGRKLAFRHVKNNKSLVAAPAEQRFH